jgi:hypothetical protein
VQTLEEMKGDMELQRITEQLETKVRTYGLPFTACGRFERGHRGGCRCRVEKL